jgi:hypothetical protein
MHESTSCLVDVSCRLRGEYMLMQHVLSMLILLLLSLETIRRWSDVLERNWSITCQCRHWISFRIICVHLMGLSTSLLYIIGDGRPPPCVRHQVSVWRVPMLGLGSIEITIRSRKASEAAGLTRDCATLLPEHLVNSILEYVWFTASTWTNFTQKRVRDPNYPYRASTSKNAPIGL